MTLTWNERGRNTIKDICAFCRYEIYVEFLKYLFMIMRSTCIQLDRRFFFWKLDLINPSKSGMRANANWFSPDFFEPIRRYTIYGKNQGNLCCCQLSSWAKKNEGWFCEDPFSSFNKEDWKTSAKDHWTRHRIRIDQNLMTMSINNRATGRGSLHICWGKHSSLNWSRNSDLNFILKMAFKVYTNHSFSPNIPYAVPLHM